MPETIYYDGHCGLCHGFVKFVLARDSHEQFHFAPLDRLTPEERQGLPDSIVVRTGDRVLVKSDAALYILTRLGGVWLVVAGLCKVFPRWLRNLVYDQVARFRYRVFGKRNEMCPLVPAELRRRFES